MSKLIELEKMGQSIWLDYIQRSMITSGELKQLVDKGLKGVTSNAEFKSIIQQPRWQELANKGARVQRVLWASTSTKNPALSDNMYVDELIGPDTVNTLPPATLESFMDHGRVAETLTQGLQDAQSQVAKLADLGVDLNAITRKLQEDGVVAFARPFAKLLASIAEKCKVLKAA